MIMKPQIASPASAQGHALVMVLIMVGVSLIMMGGLFTYSAGNAKQNERSNNYYSAVAAAEASTEKTMAQLTADFRDYGNGYVFNRLSYYRQQIPNSSESPEWDNYDFQDLSGTSSRVEIDYTVVNNFVYLGGKYGPLQGFKDQVRIVSNARKKNSVDYVVGSVYQDIQLTRIPIFQYAVFYNVPLEFTPLPDMVITGPVHCNTNIYLNPQGVLTFKSDITSSATIIEGPNPISLTLPALGGSIVYGTTNHTSGVSTMSIPIGTNNSPSAVRQVLEIPPVGESALSSLGSQRVYNQADMIVLVSNSTVVAKSGRWDSFNTTLPTNDWQAFLSTNTSFYSKRESKTVKAIQLDVKRFTSWNSTNAPLSGHDVKIIYIADLRTLASGFESGVRLTNGMTLPANGLTVATPAPLYVQGDYNVAAGARGSTNTTGSRPASLACDAFTVLSTNWNDANSSLAISSRMAGDTTVNAALVTGLVASTATADSGGVENLPRFLEDWTGKTLTYNGSMVCMFYSQVATNVWHNPAATGGPDHYNPPTRNWALDQNFQFGDKLPPWSPSLTVLVRATWRTPASFSTNVLAGF